MVSDTREQLADAHTIIEAIRPILAGHSPDVQGAALIELLAMFLAGYAPPLRDEILALHVETVRAIVPLVEHELGDPWGNKAGGAH
jgi:hypothetical protein